MNESVAIYEQAFTCDAIRFEFPRRLLLLLLFDELVLRDDQLVMRVVIVLDKLLLLVARSLFRTGQLRFQICHRLRSLGRFNGAT